MYRFILFFLIFGLAACSLNTDRSASTDIATLQHMGHTAEQRVQEHIENPILRQVNTDFVQTTFFFADVERTTMYRVTIPDANTPSFEWEVLLNNDPRLINNPAPGIDLATLKVSPQTLADELRRTWSGCEITGLTLYYELQEEDLMWTGFCQVSEGLMSGSINNRTGVFMAVDAPSVLSPPTAEANNLTTGNDKR